jgi:hypothetical protein
MGAMKSVNGADVEGWSGKAGNRLHVALEYFFAQIPRTGYKTIETRRKGKDGRPIPLSKNGQDPSTGRVVHQ